MSSNKTQNPRIKRRNELIRKRYKELTEDKHYNSNYALQLLEETYITLTQGTLWLIVTQTGHYKNY